MKKLTIVFSLIAFFFLQLITAQSELDNYLQIAGKNNPELQWKFNTYMAAMEKISQVGSLPDPTIAFGYFVLPAETKVGPQRAKINLSQRFPWFGMLKAKQDVATQQAKATYEEFENAKSNVFFEVKTAYYKYYFVTKAIQIIKDNMRILDVFQRLSLVKIESGKASVSDELRIELEINDLVNQLALATDKKNVLKVTFNNLLNRDTNLAINIPDTLTQDDLPVEKSELLAKIFNENHELKSIDYTLNSFLNQEVVAKKDGMPKFMVGLDYTLVDKIPNAAMANNGQDVFLFPSVGITIPLYRKKYKALIKEAKYQQEATSSKKEAKKNSLNTIFENSLKDFNDANRRISLNEKQSKIAKKVLDLLITEYSTNSTEFIEVLRVERQLLNYELEYQKGLADKNASIAFINYLIGN